MKKWIGVAGLVAIVGSVFFVLQIHSASNNLFNKQAYDVTPDPHVIISKSSSNLVAYDVTPNPHKMV